MVSAVVPHRSCLCNVPIISRICLAACAWGSWADTVVGNSKQLFPCTGQDQGGRIYQGRRPRRVLVCQILEEGLSAAWPIMASGERMRMALAATTSFPHISAPPLHFCAMS